MHFCARACSRFSLSTYAHSDALTIRVTARARLSSERRANERISPSRSLLWIDVVNAIETANVFLGVDLSRERERAFHFTQLMIDIRRSISYI